MEEDMHIERSTIVTSHGTLFKPSSFRLRSSSLNSVRLRRVFDLFDKNGDEIITVDEIEKALNRLGLYADPSLHSIISVHMEPGIPGFTFDDFAILHKSLDDLCDAFLIDDDLGFPDSSESDLAEAFKVFDEDGDGYISAKELQVVLNKLGLPEAKKGVEPMISSVSRNYDGVVDFSEFKYMMRDVTSIGS